MTYQEYEGGPFLKKKAPSKCSFKKRSEVNFCKNCTLYIYHLRQCVIVRGHIYPCSTCNWYAPFELKKHNPSYSGKPRETQLDKIINERRKEIYG